MKDIWNALAGRKTYIVALATAVYSIGIQAGWWTHQVAIDGILIALGGGALRSAITNAVPDQDKGLKPGDNAGVITKTVPLALLLCLALPCYAQTNETANPATARVSPFRAINADGLTGLLSAIKASTVINTGYGVSMDGARKGVLLSQQLTLVNVNIKQRHEFHIGIAHATLFSTPVNQELLGGSVSFLLFKTPTQAAKIMDSIKPITPSFSNIYGFGFAGVPVENVYDMKFYWSTVVVGGGLGIRY